MNKFKEYIDRLWNEFMKSEESFGVEHNEAFQKGFDAAIALDLPVRFMEWREGWQAKESIKIEDKHIKTQTLHTEEYYNELAPILFPNKKELYQYWIDNIYKIE